MSYVLPFEPGLLYVLAAAGTLLLAGSLFGGRRG